MVSVALSDPGCMKFQHLSQHCPLDWRRTTHWSGVSRVFQEWQVCQGAWKTVRNTFQSPSALQSRRQGPKMCKNKGTNLSHNLTRNRILSPRFENTRTLEWIFDSFPGTLTYMLFLENCWNSAPMCSFFSNPGDNVMVSAEVSCNQDL